MNCLSPRSRDEVAIMCGIIGLRLRRFFNGIWWRIEMERSVRRVIGADVIVAVGKCKVIR